MKNWSFGDPVKDLLVSRLRAQVDEGKLLAARKTALAFAHYCNPIKDPSLSPAVLWIDAQLDRRRKKAP